MPDYLTQCACFHCRKSFKRHVTDWELPPKCPDCGGATLAMGRYFRAPSVRAIKQWRKVKMLVQAGVHFAHSQSADLGQFPDTILEARAFIERNRVRLAANQLRYERNRARFVQNTLRRAEKQRAQAIRRKTQRRALLAGQTPNDRNRDA